MQTIDFLLTAKWIANLYSDDAKQVLEAGRQLPYFPIGHLRTLTSPRVTHHIAIVRERLITHPFAPEVLRAFNLTALLDENFPVELAELSFSTKSGGRKRDLDTDDEESKDTRRRDLSDDEGLARDLVRLLTPIWENWNIFTKCIQPIENLTIPQPVISEQDFDDILTIELRYEKEVNPQVEVFAAILKNIADLYSAVSRLEGIEDFPPLRLIYTDSGSSIRIDLKGIGEPIKRIKELLVEGWNLIRHRKADDFRQNNKAILESLESVQKIQSMRKQGNLSEEDALRLSRQIIESATALFEAGALPREIPKVEIVSNQVLIEGYYRKLLPPMPEQEVNALSGKNQKLTKAKTKRPRKASSKSRKS